MNQKIKKSISGVTINYEDGSSDVLQHYALVGSTDETWFKIMLSPAGSDDKVNMNNMLVDLSRSLIDSINQDK